MALIELIREISHQIVREKSNLRPKGNRRRKLIGIIENSGNRRQIEEEQEAKRNK